MKLFAQTQVAHISMLVHMLISKVIVKFNYSSTRGDVNLNTFTALWKQLRSVTSKWA